MNSGHGSDQLEHVYSAVQGSRLAIVQSSVIITSKRRCVTGTPNGWKVSILLKELNYPHTVKPISLSKSEQKQEWYTKINPNGRIPAIGAFTFILISCVLTE